jgi:dynactin complex subunit
MPCSRKRMVFLVEAIQRRNEEIEKLCRNVAVLGAKLSGETGMDMQESGRVRQDFLEKDLKLDLVLHLLRNP